MDNTKRQFTVTLEEVNSVFGISADTLRAMASCYGVTEEAVIVRALTDLAKKEIPDLDLDSPTLSEAQLNILRTRRTNASSPEHPSLLETFKNLIKGEGNASIDDVERPIPGDGKNS